MAHSSLDDDDEITGINVTPLVDVMLVLLIIFMVTASYIVQKSIDVRLPKAETAEDSVARKYLAFVLDAQSQLYLDGQPIAFEQLGPHIAEIRKSQKPSQTSGSEPASLQALITADEKTPHGQVVKLIDVVRKNGITEFAINVEAAENQPPKRQ